MNGNPAIVLPFRIVPVRTRGDIGAVAGLFADYAKSLPVDLAYQGFDVEVAELPGKYAPRRGELLLARDANDRPLGCVGLRPLGQTHRCEMKRLYVVPEARSYGLGTALAEAIVVVAEERGYAELLLDTLPAMRGAARLYEHLGFRPIAAYYAPTPHGTLFMRLRLGRSRPAQSS